MASKQKLLAMGGLLAGAIFWGVVWHPYRMLQETGVSGELSSLVTYLVALLLGLVFLSGGLREARKAPLILIGIGLAAGWANLAYVLAVLNGEVMRVLLLFYLAPLWTVIFARLLLDERPNLHGYMVIVLSLAGAIVMLWDVRAGWPLPANSAEWLGLSAGFMFALANVLTRRAHEIGIRLKAIVVWVGVSLLALIPLVAQPAKFEAIQHISFSSWQILILTGAAIFAVTLAVQYGLTHTPANQAIVIFLFELVVAAISSYYLANEVLTAKEWLGGAMIIAASLFSGELEKKGYA